MWYPGKYMNKARKKVYKKRQRLGVLGEDEYWGGVPRLSKKEMEEIAKGYLDNEYAYNKRMNWDGEFLHVEWSDEEDFHGPGSEMHWTEIVIWPDGTIKQRYWQETMGEYGNVYMGTITDWSTVYDAEEDLINFVMDEISDNFNKYKDRVAKMLGYTFEESGYNKDDRWVYFQDIESYLKRYTDKIVEYFPELVEKWKKQER